MFISGLKVTNKLTKKQQQLFNQHEVLDRLSLKIGLVLSNPKFMPFTIVIYILFESQTLEFGLWPMFNVEKKI